MESKATKNFINLSSGLAWLEAQECPADYQFVRIQSTACEQKRWSAIIEDLDYGFLMALASGQPCVVYDASARKQESRALYQGLPWIRFCCDMRWHGSADEPFVKACNCLGYFSDCFGSLSGQAKKKLDYVGKYSAGRVSLVGTCIPTALDGNYEALNSILRRAA